MIIPPFIRPEVKPLLEHYQQAVKQLAEAAPADIAGEDGLPWTGGLPDLEGAALQQLLQRQASSTLKMFEAVTSGEKLDDSCRRVAQRLSDVEQASHARLYAFRFDQVPAYWRQIYADAQILQTFYDLLQTTSAGGPDEQRRAFVASLDGVVAQLDRCLVTAGGGGRILGPAWVEKTMRIIDEAWQAASAHVPSQRYGGPQDAVEFPGDEPFGRPDVTRPCAVRAGWSIDRFEDYMRDEHDLATRTGGIGPVPLVFTDLIHDCWPALTERLWCKPGYFLRRTIGGRRLVPVEIGRSYVDDGWGQELLPFKEFLARYIDTSLAVDQDATRADPPPESSATSSSSTTPSVPGYLAQHSLFQQIPSLRNDILTPDYCWADVPPHPPSPQPSKDGSPPLKRKLDVPEVNAWFGPARTVTPLHTDGYTNLLCQVVGTKYVRLYPPGAAMRPRGRDENGVDMSNTSAIDLGAVEGWDDGQGRSDGAGDDDMCDGGQEELDKIREELKGVPYFDCILSPGDTLLIPVGWWHYVRSLSVSFSVSFWWN